jgi:hypothetical protein
MAEIESVAKIVIVLGIVFLFVGLLYPGQESGWTTFQTSIQSFPQFDNPFNGDTYEIDVAIIDDWVQGGTQYPASITDAGSVSHCDTSASPNGATEWYGCLLTQDSATSYVSTNATKTEFGMSLSYITGASSDFPVLAFKITTECRSATENSYVDYLFYNSGEVLQAEIPPGGFFCGYNTFQNVTVFAQFDTAYPTVADFNAGVFEVNPSAPTDYSYIRITAIVGGSKDCTGADTLTYIGCVIAGFFNAVIKALRFLLNGIVFIGLIIVYFGSIVAAFLVMVAFFFSVPGAPPIVQGLLSVFVVGALLLVGITIINQIRGASPV